jgi:hypothetical protein
MIYDREIFACIHDYPCEFCGSKEGVDEYMGEIVCQECKERMINNSGCGVSAPRMGCALTQYL